MQVTNVRCIRVLFLTRSVSVLPVATFLASLFLISTLFSLGCTPSSQGDGKSSATKTSDLPELTEDVIRERINDARVFEVPDESGTSEPISWGFDEDEPKEVTVVEKQAEAERATIVLDIKTMSSTRSREPRYLAGRIRTEWELESGWVMRKWRIVETHNISMKYRKLPKRASEN